MPHGVTALRSVLHKRIFKGGPLLSNGEYGQHCAQWFLEDVHNVCVFYDDLRMHGVAITELFGDAATVRSFFSTWLAGDYDDNDGESYHSDASSDPESELGTDQIEGVLFILSLFNQDTEATGIPIRLAPHCGGEAIPLHVWLLLEAILFEQFTLAECLLREQAAAAVLVPSSSFRWAGHVWRSRMEEFLDKREKNGLALEPKTIEDRLYWEELVCGDGFRPKLEFLATRLLPALPHQATSVDIILPLVAGKAEDMQRFFRRAFERFLYLCEGTGKQFSARNFIDYGLMVTQPTDMFLS